MSNTHSRLLNLVRRSKLFVPVNREISCQGLDPGADCIILDLEDAVAPADKASARKLVKNVIPLVTKGGRGPGAHKPGI